MAVDPVEALQQLGARLDTYYASVKRDMQRRRALEEALIAKAVVTLAEIEAALHKVEAEDRELLKLLDEARELPEPEPGETQH